jgi:hypothetical protein
MDKIDGILTGATLAIAVCGEKLFMEAYEFIHSEFIRAHGLNQMEANITHVCVIKKGDTIIGAGSYVTGRVGQVTVFDAGASHLFAPDDPLKTTPRHLIGEWDSIALLPKDELQVFFPDSDLTLIRSKMIDVMYAAIFLLSAKRGDHLLSMIGSIKVADVCRRIGLPARYLGPGDTDAIRAAFPEDTWDRLFAAQRRECFVLDIKPRRNSIKLIAKSVIYLSGCDYLK